MLSLALKKQNVLFSQKMMWQVGGMFSKIKLDGGSILAVMGSTSEKMYLCQVPNFGFEIIKLRPGG
jgi:Tfp pilus assembly protein PilZ